MDLSKEVADILQYEEDALSLFTKKTYDSAYEAYKEHAEAFMQKFRTLDDNEKELSIVYFVAAVSADLNSYKGLKVFQKSEALRKHNMYMVSYVLPYFMEQGEDGKVFAKKLALVWGETFKHSNITAATFEEIKSGFVTKLFGAIIQEK